MNDKLPLVNRLKTTEETLLAIKFCFFRRLRNTRKHFALSKVDDEKNRGTLP